MAKDALQSGTKTRSKSDSRLKVPKHFRVLLLNDDYTTMDFVVSILETVFRKSPAEAVQIMLAIHNRGSGVCGVFTKEIAEMKISQVHDRARREGFPLKCGMQEV